MLSNSERARIGLAANTDNRLLAPTQDETIVQSPSVVQPGSWLEGEILEAIDIRRDEDTIRDHPDFQGGEHYRAGASLHEIRRRRLARSRVLLRGTFRD